MKNTPAFPEIRIKSGDNYNPPTKAYYGGMSLRDYFAAKAMQGICASSPGAHMTNEKICAEAYELADTMLIARATK